MLPRRAPFDVTLFLDDDTYACAGGLELSLRRLAGLRKGPALRAHPFSSPSTGISPAKLRDVAACAWRGAKDAAKRAGDTVDGASLHAACADAHAKASLWCPGAQGGAILADRRTKGLAKFVDGWLETYVNVYRKYADGDAWKAGGRDGHFGADQYALERLFASSNVCEAKRAAYKLDFGYLPMNFNMRDPPSRHSCDWPLFGATHVIHHKHYVNGGTFAAAARRVDAVCDFLNAPATTPAFVVDKGAKTPRCGWM